MVANTRHKLTTNDFDSLSNESRYFILRSGDLAYAMNNLVIDKNQQALSYTIDTLPQWHSLHLAKGYGKMRYKKTSPTDFHVLNEVHIYVQLKDITIKETYLLPIDSIQKIEILVHDGKRTTTSTVLGGAAVVGGAGLAFIIFLAVALSQLNFIFK